MLRSTIRGVALLPLVLVSCSPALDSPTQPVGGSEFFVQPALIPSAADATALPINRIATVTSLVGGAVLATDSFDVSPTADEWEIEITLPGYDEVTVVVQLFLINVDGSGTSQVQFSGQTGPITVRVGEPVTPDIPIVRGPLANLNTTAVTVTSTPAILREGESANLQAAAETSGSISPSIFWASLDPAVVSIEGATATALTVGTTSIVASAGAFADTVLIEVLTSDVTAPVVAGTLPASGAVGVSTGTTIEVTFSEPIDVATVTAASVVLRDPQGAGVPATVNAQGAVATLTPAGPLDSLATYSVTVTTDVTDIVGNALDADVTWSFTTASSAVLLSSFAPGLGSLVAVAYEPTNQHLYLYDDFADSIRVYSTAGIEAGPALPSRGPPSNDIDLDFMVVDEVLASTVVPSGSLLIHNGEVGTGVLFAVTPTAGAVIDSLVLSLPGQTVGGAHHSERQSFFSIDWTTDTITEMDMSDGSAINTFAVTPTGAPPFDVFFGDMEVDLRSGHVIVVSSAQNTVRVLSQTGVFVRDVDVGVLGISSMSGIAWDDMRSVAWIVTTTGMVYEVAGIL